MADEVDRLEDLVSDAQLLIDEAKQAQEAFRVGDVAGAGTTMNGLPRILAGLERKVAVLVDQLPPRSEPIESPAASDGFEAG